MSKVIARRERWMLEALKEKAGGEEVLERARGLAERELDREPTIRELLRYIEQVQTAEV